MFLGPVYAAHRSFPKHGLDREQSSHPFIGMGYRERAVFPRLDINILASSILPNVTTVSEHPTYF